MLCSDIFLPSAAMNALGKRPCACAPHRTCCVVVWAGCPPCRLPAIKDLFYPILPGRSQARLAPAFVGCRKPRIHTGLFAGRDTLLLAILQEGDVFQSWGDIGFDLAP